MLTNKKAEGFTLVELLVGMTLSLAIMAAVFSSYLFLGRNFTRSLGISSANQPTLESQARRTLAYFIQDVRMARGILGTPSANSLILILPSATGTTTVGYANDITSPSNQNLYRVPAATSISVWNSGTTYAINDFVFNNGAGYQCLITNSGNPPPSITYWKNIPPLHTSLVSCTFNYYDSSGNPYLTYIDYVPGIKQISINLGSIAGNSANGTLSPVYQISSPRLILRNTPLLP